MLAKLKKLIASSKMGGGDIEDREKFFRRIRGYFATLDARYIAIEKAYDDAKDAFREKYRESGERYFEHIRAVALILIDHLRVKDYELIIAALLHDIVEDIPSWTIPRIRHEYGDTVAYYVELLTKPPLEYFDGDEAARDEAYHKRFLLAPRAFFLIKLADRLHNVMTLWDSKPEKRQRKILETKLYYMHFAETHFILLHELEAALLELEVHEELKKK